MEKLRIDYRSIIGLAFCAMTAGLSPGQVQTFTVANAANWGPIVAPDSIAAGFGTSLSTQNIGAVSTQLPVSLGGARVDLNDSSKVTSTAGLFFVSPGQVNFLVPSTAKLGKATIAATSSTSTMQGSLLISNVAPAIFAANGNGSGAAAAQVLQVTANGQTFLNNSFGGGSTGYGTSSFSIAPSGGTYYLVLYGTGIRNHSSNPVQATVGGVKVPVVYAGPVGSLPGLDQINLGPLPQSLAGTGKGDVDVALTVDGVPSNPVKINVQ